MQTQFLSLCSRCHCVKILSILYNPKHMNEPVTVKQLASITEAKLTGDETIVITDISHDSRRVGKGTLFAAVAGALFDAHKFVPQVMDSGRRGSFIRASRAGRFPGRVASGCRHSSRDGTRRR